MTKPTPEECQKVQKDYDDIERAAALAAIPALLNDPYLQQHRDALARKAWDIGTAVAAEYIVRNELADFI